jgi:hypothetical protein
MHRLNKVKDAKRRARKQAQKAIRAQGAGITTQRVIPDKRNRAAKHKKPLRGEHSAAFFYVPCGPFHSSCYCEDE